MKRTENTVYDIDFDINFSDLYPDVMDVNALPKDLSSLADRICSIKEDNDRLKKNLDRLKEQLRRI